MNSINSKPALILIVEDNAAECTALSRLLRLEGYNVLTASDVSQALEAAITTGATINLESDGEASRALAIGVVERTVGAYLVPDYAEILPFVVLFVVLCIRPEGLVATTRSRL